MCIVGNGICKVMIGFSNKNTPKDDAYISHCNPYVVSCLTQNKGLLNSFRYVD